MNDHYCTVIKDLSFDGLRNVRNRLRASHWSQIGVVLAIMIISKASKIFVLLKSMWTMMPVCSDIQMDLQVNEILIILVQLLQNGHLYFFEKY